MRMLPHHFLLATIVPFLSINAQTAPHPIDPPNGAKLAFQAKGEGVQVYTCSNTSEGWKWILKAPDAKLFDNSGEIVGSHFAGPTWSLKDGSQVQGELVATQPSSEANTIPWLLLRAKTGTAKGKFAGISLIQRTETHGGTAPATGCNNSAQSGTVTQVPYTAKYSFYSK